VTTFRRRSFILGARFSTESLCLKLARAFALGARAHDFDVLIADCAESAAKMHAAERRRDA